MGAFWNLAESNGRQKPSSGGAESKFRCLIIKIGAGLGFWKAALRITPYFCRGDLAGRTGDDLVALLVTIATYVRTVTDPPPRPHRNLVTSFIDPLVAFVSANAWLAYLTLFLAALLEAVPVVGSVIPGSTIILALSALVPSGDLQLPWVLAAAVAGAILGDGSAFWVGHRSQREILSTWPMANYPGVIAQSEAFFHRWGALAVFFARFVPPIRAFVPITAGALGMPAATVLRDQYSGDPALGSRPRAARRAGGIAAGTLRPSGRSRRYRQALLDAAGGRLHADHGAGGMGDPPPQWRWRHRAGAEIA